MKNIVIFASGNGSNAASLIDYFQNHLSARVCLVVTNNPSAGVINVAHSRKVMSAIVSKDFFMQEERIMRLLQAVDADIIVLAGFLQLIPAFLIHQFPKRIVNIHPALLPDFGGKGMYGSKVHEAVIAASKTESGITIHYVNEKYDEGETILQKKLPIAPGENAKSLAQKILTLEHEWLPRTIEQLIS